MAALHIVDLTLEVEGESVLAEVEFEFWPGSLGGQYEPPTNEEISITGAKVKESKEELPWRQNAKLLSRIENQVWKHIEASRREEP